jgi:hypothetical protein
MDWGRGRVGVNVAQRVAMISSSPPGLAMIAVPLAGHVDLASRTVRSDIGGQDR